MLPVPPLDGYTLLEGFIPKLRTFSPAATRQIGFYALILIIATPAGGFIWSGGAFMAKTVMYLEFLPN
jgi:Zn-dependent protease